MTDQPGMPTSEASYFEPSELPPETGDDDAFPVASTAAEAVGHPPRYSRKVGEGDAESRFPARTEEEAKASLHEIGAVCATCAFNEHCPEEACAFYRAEATALAKLGRGRTAYGGVVLPAMEE